jgi:hypothetical protein
MIDIKFKECCNHCANLDLECNCENLYQEVMAEIGCKHMEVCGMYTKETEVKCEPMSLEKHDNLPLNKPIIEEINRRRIKPAFDLE